MLGLSLCQNSGPSLRFQDARYMYYEENWTVTCTLLEVLLALFPLWFPMKSAREKSWLKCWNYFMKMTNCLYYYIYLLQVVIGGRNKYLINGCNANNTRVQDLFRSVQLNVNNPHFLIMQVGSVEIKWINNCWCQRPLNFGQSHHVCKSRHSFYYSCYRSKLNFFCLLGLCRDRKLRIT